MLFIVQEKATKHLWMPSLLNRNAFTYYFLVLSKWASEDKSNGAFMYTETCYIPPI